MAGTPRLALPFISVGQAQKEFTHNESLQILDALVGGAVEGRPLSAAPDSPPLGACYIVGGDATGAWAGKANCVAEWTSGGWRFIAPPEGMAMYDRASSVWTTFRGGAWETGQIRGLSLLINGQQVVGPRGAAIDAPAGGSVVDSEARVTIGAMLAALRSHGLIDG
jgi:hypothetical protein